MLDACSTPTDVPRDTLPAADSVQAMLDLIERMQVLATM
jgi:hypothetical protein